MAPASSVETGSYVLPLPEDEASDSQLAALRSAACLPEPLLIGNVLWFCRLRWFVIAVLMAFGLLGLYGELMARIGLRQPGLWPLLAAGVLTVSNAVFLTHARFLKPPAPQGRILLNLWGQIGVDLLVLTAVVHFIGSTETYASFIYLFHIVLACIFFSRRRSLVVTGMAVVLYTACVIAERAGVIISRGVFATASPPGPAGQVPVVFALNAVSAICIWLVVWHLTSRLSAIVRTRDVELARTNRQLLAAQEERARHMLATTHQLKAPFAAIDANAQLLLDGHCGPLPDEAREVVERISARCRRLATEIQEMLQLANLRSDSQKALPWVRLDLARLLQWGIAQVEPMAQTHEVTIAADLQAALTVGVEDHLKMLLVNLLYNAVVYSYKGGEVRVRCRAAPGGEALVTIADDGIGIAAEKLPHIFEEHYRTNEAVRHNRESSGLGLAIVRDVAWLHRIRLSVTSRLGAGTNLELQFPPPRATHEASKQRRSKMAYVMIVDDDEDFASAAAKVLRHAGHEVRVELDTDSALAGIEAKAPDLMVLDVMFPEEASAGFDFARALRQRTDALRDLPILMLTAVNMRFPLGFGSQDIDDEWLPVSDFLEKPVNLRLLPEKVEGLLHRSRTAADGKGHKP